jgi:iron complex outermembrane receptor protein
MTMKRRGIFIFLGFLLQALAASGQSLPDSTLIHPDSLREVLVTGHRRPVAGILRSLTPIENLPFAVQLVDRKLLDQQQVIDLRDALRNVSSLTLTDNNNGAYPNFNARGFRLAEGANYRRNGQLLYNVLPQYGDNLERVEVIKGPASVVFGDVAPGAVVNLVTKKPLPFRQTILDFKIGQFGLLRPSVDVNTPLSNDGKWLLRLNATYEHSGSHRREVEAQQWLLAPTLRWQPTTRFRWDLEATFRQMNQTSDPGLVSPDGTFEGMRQLSPRLFLGEPGVMNRFSENAVYSEAAFDLSAQWRIRHTAFYSGIGSTPDNIFLNPNGVDTLGNVRRFQVTFSQWFNSWGNAIDLAGRFRTGTIRHEILGGIEYGELRSDATAITFNLLGPNLNLFDPQYGRVKLFQYSSKWNKNPFFFERTGIFLQENLSFWDDKARIFLGVRYSPVRTGRDYPAEVNPPDGYRPGAEYPWLPRVGALLRPLTWLSVFGSYTASFEINGPDELNPAILVPRTLARQWEGGLRGSFWEGRFGLTLSAFQLEKEDALGLFFADAAPTFEYISFDVQAGYGTYLAPLHRSRGIELDANGKITPKLYLNAAVALVDARTVDDPAYQVGNQLAGNSRYTGSLWLTYALPKGFGLSGGAFYRSAFFQDNTNVTAGKVEAFYTFDAGFSWQRRCLTLRLNCTNLSNRAGYLSNFSNYDPLPLRRVVLGLNYRISHG